MRAATAASISAAGARASVGRGGSDTTGLSRASAGKSHSKLTPSSESPRPSANTISVADGSSDTIFMVVRLRVDDRRSARWRDRLIVGLRRTAGVRVEALVLVLVVLEG